MDKKGLSDFKAESEVTEDNEASKEGEQRQDCPKKVIGGKPSDCYFVKTGGGWLIPGE